MYLTVKISFLPSDAICYYNIGYEKVPQKSKGKSGVGKEISSIVMRLRKKTTAAREWIRKLTIVSRVEYRAGRNNIQRHLRYLFEGKDRRIWRPEHYSRNPVFTLHGYLQGEASLMYLEKFLYENGFNVDNTPYPFYRDLRFVEERLARRIRRAYEITGKKADIIGHSTGAMIALALARRIPDYIDKVIALGIPESGSEFAIAVSFLQSGRQLTPWNRFMKRFSEDSFPPGIKLYIVHGKWDILIPRKFSLYRDGARNITRILVRSSGHLGLIEKRIFPLILDILNERFWGGNGVVAYDPLINDQGYPVRGDTRLGEPQEDRSPS